MSSQKTEHLTTWPDYELIDSGEFEKLERFGVWVTRRPEPQAIWARSLPLSEWERLATATFRQGADSASGGYTAKRQGTEDERGEWFCTPEMEREWWIEYRYKEMILKLKLTLTPFKHVGLFPEQATNWNFIYDTTRRLHTAIKRPPRILNLFAYTGAASLAARAAGGEVVHLDAMRGVINWGRESMQRSELEGISWVVEDALTFIKREAKRGRLYDGIIMDPPAYGRGPDGQKWVLERNLGELLSGVEQILSPTNSFMVLNLYSLGHTADSAKKEVQKEFGAEQKEIKIEEQFGELLFENSGGRSLSFGVFYRFFRYHQL